jgi:hypothetical protein
LKLEIIFTHLGLAFQSLFLTVRSKMTLMVAPIAMMNSQTGIPKIPESSNRACFVAAIKIGAVIG